MEAHTLHYGFCSYNGKTVPWYGTVSGSIPGRSSVMKLTHEERILFTFWENRDILITVLDDGVMDRKTREWLIDLRDNNAEMLEWFGAYMRKEEIPQEDLYEED